MLFGVATPSQPEVSCTILNVMSPFKAVLSLALEVWLELSVAELSGEVVHSEEI